jgi:acyl-CoA synthetase (AMP-forming)/AMP-acid ligase II/aryl carrier-like protein
MEVLTEQLSRERLAGLTGKLVAGAEALPGRIAETWRELLSESCVFVNEYGPTEATVANAGFVVAGAQQGDAVPIGRPIPGTSMYVLDEFLEPVPIGAVGELYIGGTCLARGYANRGGLTAERFVPDPFGSPGARLYRTGDMARWLPDGDVDCLGRLDDQVKIRGYRVELGEIEDALGGHPRIAEVRVVLREDAPGVQRLAAYLVPADGAAEVDSMELRAWLARTLPEYMVPSAFVPLARIPLTGGGKLDRAALPAPGASASAAGREYVAPRTPVEEWMAEKWAEILGLERVGVEDNFFDLGGDSIWAVSVATALRAAEFEVSVRDIFAHPTVARLAELIMERRRF